MKRTLALLFAFLISYAVTAQPPASTTADWKTFYRETPAQVNDLIHTKLDVSFDFKNAYLDGKAWLTLKPHFYKTDSLELDAKGMNINKVALQKNGVLKPLTYRYDSAKLNIKLDKEYTSSERYTIYIDYTAKPNEYKAKGSEAITDAKGLYFINPMGTDSTKPTQVWTQGETEASSVWFPTIDHTNQKTTEEISMTVPAKFVTLSNGALVAQKKNADGTRTDTWKMNQPHSPYLFFMGVGDFAIVKDQYKGKEVNYYVEKDYAKVARRIFGSTPEMMAFFSKKLNYEYPWVKYAQMTGRDYVSGAMENTTATLHSDYLQQNARQLSDGNQYEDYVSHELFHQWFGDLVTAESWSNLTLNESFANYSEVLWREYKHGKDDAEAHNYADLQVYLNRGDKSKELVRFHYGDKEDMFDLISYQKGGRILNMLRNYVGDEAFFKALNLYLKRYEYKNAEAHQLRLVFEEVTGKDLNWFFNQWYFGSGHPALDIKYGYDSAAGKAIVYLRQDQQGDAFILPMAIDLYVGTQRMREQVWMKHKKDTFSFAVPAKPLLINVDADKVLLAEKTDHKNLYDYVTLYHLAKNYVDRREALDYAIREIDQADALKLVIEALKDPYHELRERALAALGDIASKLTPSTITVIEDIAKNDKRRITRAAAIDVLAELKKDDYKAFFIKSTMDSSYTIAGSALLALAKIDEKAAADLAPQLSRDAKGRLEQALKVVELFSKGDEDFEELTGKFDSTSMYDKFTEYNWYLNYLGRVNNTENFKKGLDRIIEFRRIIGGFDKKYAVKINTQLRDLVEKKKANKTSENASQMEEQITYIESKIKESL